MIENHKGIFITVEGVEGVGKSTIIKFIAHYFQKMGVNIIVTREPGGTEIAESIRQLILGHHQEVMATDTELLLMFASRAQHIDQVIRPGLLAGNIVLSDRFTDATYAYQGGGRGISIDRIKQLESWVQGGLKPDLTLLLDAPIEVGLNRLLSRGAKDRIEQEKVEFFYRVRQSYLDLAKQEPNRFVIIDATCAQEVVEKNIEGILASFKPEVCSE
jgi:dTMP kinase